ncbi:molybdopterin-dependent oxidoreductase [Microbacterium sp. HD4P20]|uniref:molybdopterin-dependent oxidoreductase n=1 Tax=Microbacterium sp. HD4P20 TaxID=2864874 RepID=UPI0020A2F98A|nr:molybdopterin-dependent oxidoreductase [Microbacterium sp. HD4P20]MCP2637626.1 molybdopterin-dependent oxidoreductase [Microbacterium sp. HD4P20]
MSDRDGIDRRGFLVGVGVSTVTLVALTAGQSFGPLAPLNAFAPRVKGEGPQGVPINRTARQAAVEEAAADPAWVLSVTRADGTTTRWDRDQLAALPTTEVRLPIACVEGWSTTADWTGVRLRDLLDLAGIPAARSVRIESLQRRGAFRATTMTPEFTRDPLTLVALELNGETLDLDHGYPARIIAPARPGVLQTKWLSSIGEIS